MSLLLHNRPEKKRYAVLGDDEVEEALDRGYAQGG